MHFARRTRDLLQLSSKRLALSSKVQRHAMTIARSRIIDLQSTRWYHCISRCVRKAFLMADEVHDRKSWIDNRLKQLEAIFAISVGGFSTMDNHLHLLLRVDPDIASNWSDHEVATRWLELYPPRDAKRQPIAPTQDMIQNLAENATWVQTARERLASLSWFMKCGSDSQRKRRGSASERRNRRELLADPY